MISLNNMQRWLGATLIVSIAALACQKETGFSSGSPAGRKASTSFGPPPVLISWLRGPDVPVELDLAPYFLGRVSPFAFAIGGKGYIGSGIIPTDEHTNLPDKPGKDVWEYDTITRAWTQKADWPGAAHSSMASFVIGASAYISSGSTFPVEPVITVKETWQYDQSSNTWTRKGDFPGNAHSGPVGAAMNGKGYVGMGSTAANGATRDWWQYDPASDSWVQKATLPGPGRTAASAFAPPVANGSVYVCAGSRFANGATTFFNDLWEYRPSTDSWVQGPDLPAAGRAAAVGISLPTTGVIATGTDGNGILQTFNDCWIYSPASKTWAQSANVGGGVRCNAGGFSIGNTLYIAAGNYLSVDKTDFWSLNLGQ